MAQPKLDEMAQPKLLLETPISKGGVASEDIPQPNKTL